MELYVFVIPDDDIIESVSDGELGVRGRVSKTDVLPSPSTIKYQGNTHYSRSIVR